MILFCQFLLKKKDMFVIFLDKYTKSKDLKPNFVSSLMCVHVISTFSDQTVQYERNVDGKTFLASLLTLSVFVVLATVLSLKFVCGT